VERSGAYYSRARSVRLVQSVVPYTGPTCGLVSHSRCGFSGVCYVDGCGEVDECKEGFAALFVSMVMDLVSHFGRTVVVVFS